jgi:hypothetical protein
MKKPSWIILAAVIGVLIALWILSKIMAIIFSSIWLILLMLIVAGGGFWLFSKIKKFTNKHG